MDAQGMGGAYNALHKGCTRGMRGGEGVKGGKGGGHGEG